jgi:predicted lipid-binding transport protein (Tim44 family)
MRRQGSGFGFVVLLVVLVVVLFLASRAFKSTLPAATALAKPSPADQEAQESAASQGGEAIRPSRMPDLKDVKRTTDAHAKQVREAVETTRE